MAALWAFTGTPDIDLERRMSAVLRHRGHLCNGEVGGLIRSSRATVGVAVPRADRQLGGVATSGSLSVAFAGRLDAPTTLADLLRTYRADGPSALAELSGEWIVVALHDERMVVARDALGVRTAYWGSHAGRYLIGVEPKAVLAAPGFPRRLDAGAIAQYLTFSFVPGERCTLRDLRELPAGHRLEIDLRSGESRVVRWFIHEDVATDEGPVESQIARVRSAIERAVDRRVPHGEPVAAFLSGGLDSSIVTAAAAATRRRRGHTPPVSLSLHFGAQHPHELQFAAAVAQMCGTDHRVLEVSGRALSPVLRRMVWHLDEPIGDPVTLGNFALAQCAADHAAWVLNGEGGDPVFGGPKNLPMLLAHWYPTLDGPNAREARYLATWRRAGDEVASLLHPDLRGEFDAERDLISVVRPYFAAERPTHFLNKLMVANMRLKAAHLIFPKVDRMLGSCGLTPLSPLSDVDVVRLSLAISPSAKLRDGVEKWVLKRAFEDVLPHSVVQRPKSGMRVPVHWWFQGDLRRESRSLLSRKAVERAGVFDPRRVRDVLDYRTGRDGLRLWMLVTFELWRRMVFDAESP